MSSILLTAVCLEASPSTQPERTKTVEALLSAAIPHDALPTDRNGWSDAKRIEINNDLAQAIGSEHPLVKVAFVVEGVHYVDKDSNPGPLKLNKSFYLVQAKLHPFGGVPVHVWFWFERPPKVDEHIEISASLNHATLELDNLDGKKSGAWFLFTFNFPMH